MADTTARLGLPLILSAQAQKHVTHNEALATLDLLVQAVLSAVDAETPPAVAVEGQAWGLGAAPTAAWAGHPGAIAQRQDGAWRFVTPAEGWLAWDLDSATMRVWDGTAWVALAAALDLLQNLQGVGIGAAADATNRLAVASPAVLLNHAGDDIRLKLNKASAAATASLLFQAGFSGRAEMGLTGTDDFAIKVSADGGGWTTALAIARATGLATGAAVQISATDATQGRLARVGAFGIGMTGNGNTIADLDDPATPTGLYRFINSTSSGIPPVAVGGYVLLQRYAGDYLHQTFIREEGSSRGIWTREYRVNAWTAWERVLRNHDILGTVGQSSGGVTGALIERGSNANGEYVRFADGTQICTWSSGSVGPIDTASGNVFRSGAITWPAYPAAFAAVTPKVIWTVDHPAGIGGIWLARETTQTTTTTPGGVYMMRSVSSPVTTAIVGATAIGRWF